MTAMSGSPRRTAATASTSSGSASGASGPSRAGRGRSAPVASSADRARERVEVGRVGEPSLGHDGTRQRATTSGRRPNRAARAASNSARYRAVGVVVRPRSRRIRLVGARVERRQPHDRLVEPGEDAGPRCRPSSPRRAQWTRPAPRADGPARHVGLDPEQRGCARPPTDDADLVAAKAHVVEPIDDVPQRRRNSPRGRRARCRRPWPSDSPANAPRPGRPSAAPWPGQRREEPHAVVGAEPAAASPSSRPIALGRRGCPRRTSGRCRRTRSRDARRARPAGRVAVCLDEARVVDRGSRRRCDRFGCAGDVDDDARSDPGSDTAPCSSPVPTTTRSRRRPHACATSSRSGPAMSVAGRSSPRRPDRGQRHEAAHPTRRVVDVEQKRHEAFAGSTTRRPVRQATIGGRQQVAVRDRSNRGAPGARAIFGAPCDGSAFAPDSSRSAASTPLRRDVEPRPSPGGPSRWSPARAARRPRRRRRAHRPARPARGSRYPTPRSRRGPQLADHRRKGAAPVERVLLGPAGVRVLDRVAGGGLRHDRSRGSSRMPFRLCDPTSHPIANIRGPTSKSSVV